MFRSWGADVINMSTVPEVVLAREAGICYAAVAMSTDYDCWHESEEAVTIEAVLTVFKKNAENVLKLFLKTIPKIQERENIKERDCHCQKDILGAVIGHSEDLSAKIIKNKIRTVANWPKSGIMFRDITTLLQDPNAFKLTIQKLKEKYQAQKLDKIAGIESRGFIFAAALAQELNLPLVLIRKKGKLPAETVAQEYELEYGMDKIEIHKDALHPGEKVLILDDLLATGGTLLAACKLVEKLNAIVAGCACVVNLPELKGKEKLKNYDVFYLVEFEGE
jgi:adenine phosphoribosyltransferase